MEIGSRIYYNQKGDCIFYTPEYNGENLKPRIKEIISYIDLPYGDKSMKNVEKFHIDVENKKIIVDKYIERKPSYEDLENQLILTENDKIEGGIF